MTDKYLISNVGNTAIHVSIENKSTVIFSAGSK